MSEIIKGCLGFKGEKGEHGEVGTPIPYEGTFQELQNSEENRDRFYIIMDEQDEVYYKHWVYYDEKTEQWKDGGEYLANLVINLEDLTQEEWESLKSNLTNYYKRYESVYTTTQENEINIPINISQYNTLAILEVYIEGRMLNRNEYAINGTNSITLNIPLSEIGTKVHFIVYRSVCASNEDLNELKGPKGDSGAIVFNTISEMKEDEDLVAGDTCQVLGYNTKNDGKAFLYNIVNDSTLVADNYNTIDLENGLKAIRVSEKNDTKYVSTSNTSLDDYTEEGWYFFEPPYAPTNSPAGVNGFLEVKKSSVFVKQFWYRAGTPGSNDFQTFVRTKGSTGWGNWKRYTVPGDLYWTKTNHEILSKYASYYVDGVNGNDSNDGKSQAKAFKTLAPVWEAVKQGDMEIRFALAGGSTYVWDPYIINNLSIHIWCYGTGDVTIQMPDEPIAFYDCHINFRGNANQKLIFTGAQRLYLDSGSADLQYIDMQFNYTNWGAGSRIINSNMRGINSNYSNMHILASNISNIYATSSNITFESCVFLTEYSDSNIFMDLIGCNILIFGPTKVDMKGAVNTGTFMKMTGGHSSQLSAMNAINVQNNVLYNLGLQATGAIILATTARFNSFSNVATTPSSLIDGSICTANL